MLVLICFTFFIAYKQGVIDERAKWNKLTPLRYADSKDSFTVERSPDKEQQEHDEWKPDFDYKAWKEWQNKQKNFKLKTPMDCALNCIRTIR